MVNIKILSKYSESKSTALSLFSGKIVMQQTSEYEPTRVYVRFINLQGIASGYGVHEWPVPIQLTTDESVCSPEKVGGHYNPFNIDIKTSPPSGTGTPDQYEIGDLTGKYGTYSKLDDLNEFDNWFADDNLPLFGKNSVEGRSLVIYKKDGSRWICSTIVPRGEIIRAVATFKSPVIGRIVLTQDANDRYADTQVFVELNYANGVTSPTKDHDWHVHVNRVCSDFNGKSCECSAAGGHYNPFKVNLDGDYKTECSRTNPFRCEMGDLSRKHGKLSVRAKDGDFSRALFTDEHLRLTSLYHISQKSIVIYDVNSGAGRLACANIHILPPRELSVDRWYEMAPSNVNGSFHFTGNLEKYLDEWTNVKLELFNMDNTADGFHVHKYPVPSNSSTPCSPAAVGGHFNPFNVDIKQSPPPGTGTHDLYEVGDLSGKHGKLLTGKVVFANILFWYFKTSHFCLQLYSVWLRTTDEGSISEIRIWSIIFIQSKFKMVYPLFFITLLDN